MKVNVGSSRRKKSFFPIPFDSSTTTNFGECVPTFCQEVITDSHVKIDMKPGVRLAPLSLPTFGKAFLHSYAYYHKFVDLWAPYNDFLAQTPFTNSSGTSYIPTKVPCVPLSLLWMICCCHSTWSVYKHVRTVKMSPSGAPLNVSTFEIAKFKSTDIPSLDALNRGFVRTLASAARCGDGYLPYGTRLTNYLYNLDQDPPSTFIPSSEDDSVTPQGSDFMFVVPANSLFTWVAPSGSSGAGTFSVYTPPSGPTDFLVCLKLNNSGKLLRKIFLGLGYQLKLASNEVSMLPLFAFYKSYFNTFAPKRFVKYEQTFFGKLMTHLVNTGESVMDTFNKHWSDDPGYLSGIIDDLLSCFYTQDTDYYSSQIIGLVNDYGGDIYQKYMGVNDNGMPTLDSISSSVGRLSAPGINFDEGSGSTSPIQHTQAQQNILARLTNFVNKRSLLGGKVADLLESEYGIPKGDVLDGDNPYVGSSVVDVDFSDVFSTAETAEGSLGEYAGKAIGIGRDTLDVNCSSPGLVLVFETVVPRTQKVQGVNPSLFHLDRSSFYNPDFDGLTLLPTNKLGLYCVDSPMERLTEYDKSFGNQSLFAEYKTRTQGVLNGDLSLLSTKSTYDSFTMDQTIANYVTTEDSPSTTSDFLVTVTAPDTQSLSAGTMWRFIGRWLWLGNFDRIFVNTRQFFDLFNAPDFSWTDRDVHTTDDNLIVHNVIDLKINAPMLPLEDSYMTKDLEDLSNDSGFRAQSE